MQYQKLIYEDICIYMNIYIWIYIYRIFCTIEIFVGFAFHLSSPSFQNLSRDLKIWEKWNGRAQFSPWTPTKQLVVNLCSLCRVSKNLWITSFKYLNMFLVQPPASEASIPFKSKKSTSPTHPELNLCSPLSGAKRREWGFFPLQLVIPFPHSLLSTSKSYQPFSPWISQMPAVFMGCRETQHSTHMQAPGDWS